LVLAGCGEEAPLPQAAPQPAPPAAPLAKSELQNPPAAAPQPEPDAELAARVKKALDAASADISQGIDVTAKKGAVHLYGTVPSRAARRNAEKAAASTQGVSSVDNRLVVVKGS
jgi:osmotically-inducible protein OsmY